MLLFFRLHFVQCIIISYCSLLSFICLFGAVLVLNTGGVLKEGAGQDHNVQWTLEVCLEVRTCTRRAKSRVEASREVRATVCSKGPTPASSKACTPTSLLWASCVYADIMDAY